MRSVRPLTCVVQGTRPLMLEIQSLVAPSDLAMPRRVATGIDQRRLAMIVAVLARHGQLPLGSADVFVNVAGGLRLDDPGADLAVALAIASASRGVPSRPGSRASASWPSPGGYGHRPRRPAASTNAAS